MSTGHRFLHDFGKALSSGGDHVIAPPASGGTFAQRGLAYGTATVGAGTYTLPDNGLPMYVRATGAVTIQSAAAVTIATPASGEVALCVPVTSTTWAATVFTAGAIEINTAADVPVVDSGAYFTGADLEAVTQSLGIDSGYIDVDLTSFLDADGDPLAKFADNASPNPGFNLADSESLGIRWNNNATQNQPVISSFRIPPGAIGKVLTAHVIASKTGATVGDATTFTFTAFANDTASLHDAGADIGGATSAMTGNATAKTVQHVTRAFTTLEEALSGPLPVVGPANLTFTITPTSGTLGTDDVVVERIYFTYPK